MLENFLSSLLPEAGPSVSVDNTMFDNAVFITLKVITLYCVIEIADRVNLNVIAKRKKGKICEIMDLLINPMGKILS